MYARSFFIALLVTFFVTNFSFGACVSGNFYYNASGFSFSGYTDNSDGTKPTSCNDEIACYSNGSGDCASVLNYGGSFYSSPVQSRSSCTYNGCISSACGSRTCYTITFECRYQTRCDTQAEADSISCEQEGGQWNGTSCIQGDTTSCETQRARCEAGGGKFSGTEQANGGCAAHCSLCDSPILKQKLKAFGLACCNENLVPPDSSENQICWDELSGGGTGMTESNSCLSDNSCLCGVPYDDNGKFNMLEYAKKCGGAEGGQDPNSSASEGGSSSSSSSSDSSSVPPQVQVLGLEGLMDSLHKIIYNTAEVDTTTTFMLMCMQNPELYCPSLLGSSSSGDTIIIEGDTTIVNVPSDSVIIAEVSENIKNQGARTRNKLDSMTKELLDSMSQSDRAYRVFDSSANYHRDSLLGIIGAMQIVEGNETQALLDSVIGKLKGVIGELAGFGDKLDSLELNLPDTTLDLGGSDTATIRGTIDSLGEWVGGLISPDSAGGWGSQNSDGSYGDGSGYGFGIKKGANDSLGSQLGGLIGGMVDTGAVADILDTMKKWQDAFDFGASASTGGCPSILTRQYQINIGGASFSMPPIGQYLCSTISGFNTTMWDVGRMVLRALVSIMCFLWLFKICVTEGKGDD